MKYIVIDNGMYECPVIFDEGTQHFTIADALAGKGATNIVSAGFVEYTPNGLNCYGDSISLGVESRKEDTDLINRMIGWPND